MTYKGLGRMQLKILQPMGRNSGMWPAAWKLGYRDRALMDGLHRRGLVRPIEKDVTAPDAPTQWILTDLGREALRNRPIPTHPKIDRRRKDWSAR